MFKTDKNHVIVRSALRNETAVTWKKKLLEEHDIRRHNHLSTYYLRAKRSIVPSGECLFLNSQSLLTINITAVDRRTRARHVYVYVYARTRTLPLRVNPYPYRNVYGFVSLSDGTCTAVQRPYLREKRGTGTFNFEIQVNTMSVLGSCNFHLIYVYWSLISVIQGCESSVRWKRFFGAYVMV